jgi:sugar lactone lactonase YvrE
VRVEQVTDPVAHHGEGPVWSAAWGGLRWLDMLAGDLLSFDPDGGVARRHVGSVVAAVRPRRGGGAVLAVERGFALEDPEGEITYLPELWSGTEIRMNEGGCDPDGRFYCGSMGYDQSPGAASLYRLDPDLTVHTILTGVTISNGLEWSPDGSRAYYNDTATRRISVFDYDVTAGLTNRRTFAEIPDEGSPDGLTVDAEGGVWTAIYDRGRVHRYRPDGVLDEVLEVPARKVTACAFGGEHLDELFLTTSREGLEEGDEPLAGSLFRARPGVTGLPVKEFG